METMLSERDLEEALTTVLERAHHGERFVVERDGVRLAVISPPISEPKPGILGSDLVARIGDLHMPGDGFADDITAARTNLIPASVPPWRD